MSGITFPLLYSGYRRGGVLYSPRVAAGYRIGQDCRLPKNCKTFSR